MITFLPEHYLVFSILFLLIFFCIFSLSLKLNFPSLKKAMPVLTILCLTNYLITTLSDLSFGLIYSNNFFIKTDFSSTVIFITSLFCIFLVLNVSRYNQNKNINYFEFYIFILLTLFSASLLISSIEFFSFYFLLELQGVLFYILAAYHRTFKNSIESGIKYLILNSLSSILLLLGFSFAYTITGSFHFNDFIIQTPISYSNELLLRISCSFILVSFFFKVYNAPFHFWIADIYEGSPTSSVSIFSLLPLLSIFYSFAKVIYLIYQPILVQINTLYLIFGIGTMFIGTLLALYQRKLKRIIAYSSITNIGYAFNSLIGGNFLNLSNGFLFLYIYLINLLGLFIIILNLVDVRTKFFFENVADYTGFFYTHKNFSILFLSYLFSLGGIPPFSVFIAKLLLLTSLINQLSFISIMAIIISTFLTCFYYLRVVKLISYNVTEQWYFIKPFSYVSSYSIIFISLAQFLFFFKLSFIFPFISNFY